MTKEQIDKLVKDHYKKIFKSKESDPRKINLEERYRKYLYKINKLGENKMKNILCVTYDTVTGEQRSGIQQYRNIADAKRSYAKAIQTVEENNTENIPLKDLQLFQIAEFDTETLEITACKEFICNASEFLKRGVIWNLQQILENTHVNH